MNYQNSKSLNETSEEHLSSELRFNRLDGLLALRACACLMIVVFHCNPPRKAILYGNYDLSWLIFSHGQVAVWIFFCLSGYLMGKAFYSERYSTDLLGVISFWRNRILRICPLYYFAVLILILFVYPEILKIENWGYLFRICTFTYNHSLAVDFNGAFWTLSTEVQFYIFVPFIYMITSKFLKQNRQVILAIVGIIFLTFILKSIILLIFQTQIYEQINYFRKYCYTPLITNLDIFLLGFLINPLLKYHSLYVSNSEVGATSNKILPSFKVKFIAIALVLWLYFFAAHHLYHQELWNLVGRPGGIRTSMTLLVLPILTALIVAFFIFTFESGSNYLLFQQNEKLSFASCLKNPLRTIEVFGNLSYGIYLWHLPIVMKITPVFQSSIPIEAFLSRLVATLILSTFLASVTYYVVELPAAHMKSFNKS